MSAKPWPINKEAVFWLSFIHLLGFAAIPFFTWNAFGWMIVLLFTLSPIGVNLTFHRLISHQAFKVSKPVEYVLVTLGVLAGQGSPLAWVGTHRMHHAYSDTKKDVHSPINGGFWWSHMMHLLYKHEWFPESSWRPWVKDLSGDPYYEFLHKYTMPVTFIQAPILFALGGMPLLMWGGFMRVVVMLHLTWCVNSVTHLWGYRSHKTSDRSQNNFVIGFLAAGEGWHNNHHAAPRSARHGIQWWEFDLTYVYIRLLKAFGLARDLVPFVVSGGATYAGGSANERRSEIDPPGPAA